MLVEQLTIYDSWKQELPSIPARSPLYQLVPVGMGTSHVESLTSFIARLAEVHCLLPKTLITEIIAPHIQHTFVKRCTSRGLGALFERARTINGSGSIAKDFIRAIETLTCHQNLQFLTLITWSDILGSKGLFRNHKAWCSTCYQEWFTSANIVYEPLLWSLQAIEICSKHHILLSEICPHCHQQLPLLSWRSRLGVCSNCHNSLIHFGSSYDKNANFVFKTKLEKSIWITNSLEELIALSPKLCFIPSRDTFINNIYFAANIIAGGNITNLASLLNIPKNTFWGRLKGKAFPSLDTLLNIAWRLSLSLVYLLTQDIQTTEFEGLSTNFISCFRRQKRSSPRQFNYHRVQQVLLDILNQDDIIPTIKQIALDLGYSRRLIARHFPDLCHAIVAKRRSLQKANHATTIQNSCQKVRQAVLDLYSRGEYPTEARVAELISQPGFLRYKQLRAALRQARHELGLEP